jgi:hypothetical protein
MSGQEKKFQENNIWNYFVLQHKRTLLLFFFDFFFSEEVKAHYDDLFWGILGLVL